MFVLDTSAGKANKQNKNKEKIQCKLNTSSQKRTTEVAGNLDPNGELLSVLRNLY